VSLPASCGLLGGSIVIVSDACALAGAAAINSSTTMISARPARTTPS
jgi:hypothetical protein